MSFKGSFNLGAVRGIGSSTRMFNYCTQRSPQPWNCIDQFITIVPPAVPAPVPGKLKAVFFINLTTTTNFSLKNTLNYYWDNYPQEFLKCPIVDSAGSLDKILSLLDEYYGYGFRYFISFQTSNILAGVLASTWFDFHPDATGISPSANSNSLSIPKNVYRILPDNSFVISSISTQINNAISGGYNIFYLYTADQLVCTDALRILNETIGNYSNYATLATTFPELDTPTVVQNFFDAPPNGISSSNDILILLLLNRTQYITLYDVNAFTDPLTFTGQQYDILASVTPTIPSGSQASLLDKYNTPLFKGVNTSILWRNGYNTLGSSNYSTVALNILNMLNQFSNNQAMDNINSHYNSLIFDPVTKDIQNPSILLEVYKNGSQGNNFYSKYLYVNDPYLGEYNANFVSSTPVPTSVIPVSPNKIFYGKAIALLELGYINQTDTVLYNSLYYFWYLDTSLPKFPITDITDFTGQDVANALTSYYGEGYRLFLGPNFGHLIATTEVLDWFRSHPDTICISLSSGVTILDAPLNIYRLSSKDSEVIALVINKIYASQNIYYIYDYGDPVGTSVNNILYNLFGTSTTHIYNSFAIDSTSSNLTVSNMLAFFGINPVSANPVTVNDLVIILSNANLQNYLNLYENTSMNAVVAPQYITSNQVDPSVPSEGTVLNNNLYSLENTYPNTSYLWNENRIYLTDIYLSSTESRQLLNALKMMQYILAGKDIKLLGSHSGTLQFSTIDSNILYPSVLFLQYQATPNKFVNYEINFQDPLLGIFNATFV